ncbi:hypothetical protein HOM13_00390 [Candidatus Woesearchaeota archaeon]|jgi:hypothetical protein|nr:hypothetical protein [Candidatus Woesearchaeota archaeon]MBT5215177.1 hypothetical protein [Candidatus Woesearchaeota archaeon]MBT6402528.1 hypothetical protein [Candidatus Woesearchaeota archaeon]
MVNKKGFIRTMEAVLAIILLLTLVNTITPKQDFDISKPNSIKQAHSAVLSEVSINQTFRDCLLDVTRANGALNNASSQYPERILQTPCVISINKFIEPYTPHGYVYLAEICDQSKSCLQGTLPVEKTIFTESIMLASDNPKIFRVYFWDE